MGHQVSVLYELVMADAPEAVKKEAAGDVDALKYQAPAAGAGAAQSGDILTFKLRYHEPEGEAGSKLLEFVLPAQPEATKNWGWASSVAEVALLLRDSPNKGTGRLRGRHQARPRKPGRRSRWPPSPIPQPRRHGACQAC